MMFPTVPVSGEAACIHSGTRALQFASLNPTMVNFGSKDQNETQPAKRKRNPPGNPDPAAEVVALSPRTLLATNRFVCEVCNKGFQRDQNLQLHMRGHNLPWKLKQRNGKEPRRKVYVCPEATCIHHHPSRALGDLTGIKKHFCRKHGEKKWKCEKCSKVYAVQSDWKAHSKTCGTKEYQCNCGTVFSRWDSFDKHKNLCGALFEESVRHTEVANTSPVSTQQNPDTDTPSTQLPTFQFNHPPPPPLNTPIFPFSTHHNHKTLCGALFEESAGLTEVAETSPVSIEPSPNNTLFTQPPTFHFNHSPPPPLDTTIFPFPSRHNKIQCDALFEESARLTEIAKTSPISTKPIPDTNISIIQPSTQPPNFNFNHPSPPPLNSTLFPFSSLHNHFPLMWNPFSQNSSGIMYVNPQPQQLHIDPFPSYQTSLNTSQFHNMLHEGNTYVPPISATTPLQEETDVGPYTHVNSALGNQDNQAPTMWQQSSDMLTRDFLGLIKQCNGMEDHGGCSSGGEVREMVSYTEGVENQSMRMNNYNNQAHFGFGHHN